MEASLLVRLPTSVGCAILRWLPDKCVARLDVAYCKKSERRTFLDLLQTCGSFVVPDWLSSSVYFGRLRWMNERNIGCSQFKYFKGHVSSKGAVTTLARHIKISAPRLKSAEVHDKLSVVTTLLGLLSSSFCSLETLKVSASFGGQSITDDWVSPMQTLLANSATTLHHLTIHFTVPWSVILKPSLQFPALLRVKMYVLYDEDLVTLCTAAPNLQKLKIEHMRCTAVGLSVLGQYCHNLEYLSLFCTHPFTTINEGMVAIAQGCRKLKSLSTIGFQDLTDVGLSAVATHCTQLQELTIIGSRLITDVPLIALAHSASASLQLLVLKRGCTSLTGAGAVAIAQHCALLHTIDVRELTTAQLLTAVPYMKNIRVLILSYCHTDDAVLELIAQHMPLLRELDVTPQNHSTLAVASLDRVISKCEKLTHLALGWAPDDDEEWEQWGTQWRATRPKLKIRYDCS